jgi:phosphoribosylamine--glycine ligase
LYHSSTADGGAMALRCQEEGNEVKLLIPAPQYKHCLDGLIPKVDSIPEGLRWDPDLIIFDFVESGGTADRLRKAGRKVIGGSVFQDKIELDRSFAMELCKKMGISVPEYKEFKASQIKEAKEYAKTQKRMVFKPSGNLDKALSYCAKDQEDMIRFLQWVEDNKAVKGDFILQVFIKGIEISTEVWFSNGKPVFPANGEMEAKKLMAGDIGPNTGCMGCVTWFYPIAEPRIVQQTLKKLYPPLAAIGYTGPLDINSIVTEDGEANFLEFTARFGYSSVYSLSSIMNTPLSELLYKCAEGTMKKIDFKSEFGLSCTISIPPYPLDPESPQDIWEFKETEGHAIKGIPMGHSWLLDAKKDAKGELVTAGANGLVLNVTASGASLLAVKETLYKRVDEIDLADKMYRNDLMDRPMKQLPKLRAMNYQVPDPQTFYGKKSVPPARVPATS